MTALAEVVAAHAAIGATTKRTEKAEAVAAVLRDAEREEVAPLVAWLSGALTQRQIGVGRATLADPPPPAPAPSLDVRTVEAAFAHVGALAGSGSVDARRAAVRELLARATADEQRFLARLLLGDLGQGALAGVVADGVARAAGVPLAAVRRALTFDGDLPALARLALDEGAEGLAQVRLAVGRPVAPMLAATAASVEAAFQKAGGQGAEGVKVDAKLDGARVQVHRRGDDVGVFTRTLDDVTARLPEVVAFARALPAQALVLDAEAIALRPDGRPEPFQVTASRFGRRSTREVPLTVLAFDVLHVDGRDLVDAPLLERADALAQLTAPEQRVPRTLARTVEEAQAAEADALAAGHEGVMVKAVDGHYAAGRRATGWLKVKPVHTLDLVVLAAEWGHGRRSGSLSNLHLGARDEATAGGFAMVGKTFKGLTDDLLAWQTGQLLAREVRRTRGTVHVRPELVVEIAVDGVQTSTRYASGAALRFARVREYRADKRPDDADTLAAVLALRDRDA